MENNQQSYRQRKRGQLLPGYAPCYLSWCFQIFLSEFSYFGLHWICIIWWTVMNLKHFSYFGCHWYDDICPERKGRITRHSWIIIIFSNYELKFKLVVFFFNLQGYLTMLPLNSSNIKFSLLVFSMVSWFVGLTAGTKRRLSI